MIDITCICLTHGRPWLLNEAVESFLRQRVDGFTAELLIVNDCIEQTLLFNHPRVKIIQVAAQFEELSHKINFAIAKASGKWLAMWEDDDISLPERLAWSVGMIARKPHIVLFRPQHSWHWNNGTIRARGSSHMCNALMRRDACLRVGGAESGQFIDRSLWNRIREAGDVLDIRQIPEETYYVYRWAGVGYHDSGEGITDAKERAIKFHAEALADKKFEAGVIHLQPHWEIDYVRQAQDAIRDGPGNKLM